MPINIIAGIYWDEWLFILHFYSRRLFNKFISPSSKIVRYQIYKQNVSNMADIHANFIDSDPRPKFYTEVSAHKS